MRLLLVISAFAAIAILALPARGVPAEPDPASWANPVNRNLYRIAKCETGGKPGQHGRPDWTHRARSPHYGHGRRLYYEGALGFLETTWDAYRLYVLPETPTAKSADRATPAEQYAVGRILVRVFNGYSSWPSCSRKLGLR